MKIVVAPNAFKGSLSAREAAVAMADGIRRVVSNADIVLVPVADGGDGLVEVALESLQGDRCRVLATGPRFDLVEAQFCHVPELGFAAIEMAQASGLTLLPEHLRDPLLTTTFGTGELIQAAIDLGVYKVGIGIGGSATNDGGIGMAAALGVQFLDNNGRSVRPVGGSLQNIAHIDISGLDPRIKEISIEGICDVDNPLLGTKGAARTYGPQKGATREQVEQLEAGLANLARVIQTDLAIDVTTLPGGGAAGGLGAGLYAFLGATLRPGVDVVMDLVGLEEKLEGADLALTGEGQIDSQTCFGKAPVGVARRAKNMSVPCIALAGSVDEELADVQAQGIDAVFSLCTGPMTLDAALSQADVLVARVTEQVVRCFLSGRKKF